MARLHGPAVYYNGEVYKDGDELPSELAHLARDGAEAPATAGGTGDPGDAAADPDFDPEKATVPQLRDELDRLGVEYSGDDRKDALRAKYDARVSGQ